MRDFLGIYGCNENATFVEWEFVEFFTTSWHMKNHKTMKIGTNQRYFMIDWQLK